MSKKHPTLDKDLFWRLIEISTALSSERNKARLFEKILDAAQDQLYPPSSCQSVLYREYKLRSIGLSQPSTQFHLRQQSSISWSNIGFRISRTFTSIRLLTEAYTLASHGIHLSRKRHWLRSKSTTLHRTSNTDLQVTA